MNFAVAVKLYFFHFFQIKMVGKLKSHGIAWNQLFCDKNAGFSPNHNVLGGKCARYKRLDIKWIPAPKLGKHSHWSTQNIQSILIGPNFVAVSGTSAPKLGPMRID